MGHIYSLKKSTWQMQVFSRKIWKDEKVHWEEPNQTWTSILLAVKSSVTHTNFNTEPISQNYSSQFSGQRHPKQLSGANYGTEKLVLDIFISQITLMLPRSLFDFFFQCHNSRNAINHFAVCIRVLTLGTCVWLLWIFRWKIFSLKLHFSSLNKFVYRRSNLACRPAWKRCVFCL